jgi:hypothetical protein
MGTVNPPSAPPAPVVIRISPMAHLGVGFLTIALMAVVLGAPVTTPLLLVPVLLSVAVVRYRTVADGDGVTARTLLSKDKIAWNDIEGLRFGKGSWAYARCADGTEVRLPAVTFATLPLLTDASGGRVPNPYA